MDLKIANEITKLVAQSLGILKGMLHDCAEPSKHIIDAIELLEEALDKLIEAS